MAYALRASLRVIAIDVETNCTFAALLARRTPRPTAVCTHWPKATPLRRPRKLRNSQPPAKRTSVVVIAKGSQSIPREILHSEKTPRRFPAAATQAGLFPYWYCGEQLKQGTPACLSVVSRMKMTRRLRRPQEHRRISLDERQLAR